VTSLAELEDRLAARFGATYVRVAPLLTGPAADANTLRGTVEVPGAADIVALPAPGTEEHAALAELGARALGAGEVGSVVLAGGMATRFGGAVKALCDAVGTRRFLDLKLADQRHTARAAGHPVPLFFMTSFATDAAIRAALEGMSAAARNTRCFSQCVALRVTPEGAPFLGTDGEPSLYAPGHGDLTLALRNSGVLAEFRAGGGKYLLMSNVDNLVATLDPAVIGAHIRGARPVTVEVVQKNPGDVGGAPARVNGTLQIVEAFRFPASFDQGTIPVFNTNTFVFDAPALDRDFDLTMFRVQKKVDGRDAIQFERLVGELTAFLPTTFLAVPRTGVDTRFLPAKDPAELAARRPDIEAALKARGIL
jgi:UTP--glucose-1-phosphate uridylyltransferase